MQYLNTLSEGTVQASFHNNIICQIESIKFASDWKLHDCVAGGKKMKTPPEGGLGWAKSCTTPQLYRAGFILSASIPVSNSPFATWVSLRKLPTPGLELGLFSDITSARSYTIHTTSPWLVMTNLIDHIMPAPLIGFALPCKVQLFKGKWIWPQNS